MQPFQRGEHRHAWPAWGQMGVCSRENQGRENGSGSMGRLESPMHMVTTHPQYPRTLRAFLSLYLLKITHVKTANTWSLTFTLILWWLIQDSGISLIYKQRLWQSAWVLDCLGLIPQEMGILLAPHCPFMVILNYFQHLLALDHLTGPYHPQQLFNQSPTHQVCSPLIPRGF